MPNDSDEPVVLYEARTDFEAQAIVQALAAEGVPAFVADAASADMLSSTAVRPKVMVRRVDADRAMLALRALKADSVDINWDELDVGSDREASEALRNGGLSRRAVLTMAIVLLAPLAAFCLMVGYVRHDPTLLAIGTAVAMFAVLATLGSRRTLPPYREAPPSDDRPFG